MEFYEVSHDCEAESQTTVSASGRAVSLSETFEDVRQKLGIDAWTSIVYFDFDVTVFLTDTNADNAAHWRKLRSIRKQVPNHLLQAIAVAGDDRESALIVRFGANILSVERWSNCVECGVDDRHEIHWSKM